MGARSSRAKVLAIGGGIGAAVIIGVIVYGEATRPLGSDILERPTVQWAVGNGLEPGTALEYRLSHAGNGYRETVVTMNFMERSGEADWNTRITVAVEEDAEGAGEESEIILSKHLIPAGDISEEFAPRMRLVQDSILWIVDYAATPKYLAPGASWGTITHGVQTQDLRITAAEEVSTPGGAFDSFVLSYSVKDKVSKIWIAEEMPLPIRAEVYGADGDLEFEFELTSLSSSP